MASGPPRPFAPTPRSRSCPSHSPNCHRLGHTKGSGGRREPLARGSHTAASQFGGWRQRERRQGEVPAGRTPAPGAVLIWTAAAGGGERARVRRAGSAALAPAGEGARWGGRRLPRGNTRGPQGRRPGRAGPQASRERTLDPGQRQMEQQPHHLVHPRATTARGSGRGGLGGSPDPAPSPEGPGFSALHLPPTPPRAHLLHGGSRAELPKAGGGG